MGMIVSVTPNMTRPRIITRNEIFNELIFEDIEDILKDIAKVKIHEYVQLPKLVTSLKFEELRFCDKADGNTDLLRLIT